MGNVINFFLKIRDLGREEGEGEGWSGRAVLITLFISETLGLIQMHNQKEEVHLLSFSCIDSNKGLSHADHITGLVSFTAVHYSGFNVVFFPDIS